MRGTRPAEADVLAKLDHRPTTAFYWQLTLLSTIGGFLFGYDTVEVFPTWQSGVGLAWVMISFAGLCVLAIVFVVGFLPETKGHSVEEIIGLFERQARGRSGAIPGAEEPGGAHG